MFTRCPECLTVFHISAAELRAADGAVVCGECHASFDALATLSETPSAEVPRRPAAPPPASPPAEPVFEAELEPDDEPEVEPEPEPEIEPEPEVDLESELEPELEPELLYATEDIDARDEDDFLQELEALIGPEEPGAEPEFGPAPQPEPLFEPAAPPAHEPEPEPEPGSEPETEARADWEPEQELDEASEEDWEDYAGGEPAPWGDDDTAGLGQEPFLADEEPAHAAAAYDDEPKDEPEDEPEDEAPEKHVTTDVAAHDAVLPDESDEDVEVTDEAPARAARSAREPFVGDEELDPEDLPEFAALQPRRRRWPMVLLVVLVLLVVAGAWAHSERGSLLRHPLGAAILGPVYDALGLEATARWRPGDFQALKWEAGADPAQPERLVVAVEFVNAADFAQPYPVLRVVLEDRFGRRVGSHDVEPSQYLEGYSKGRRLPSGARVRTTLEVPDPGARAEGFRIDFCLESGAQGLVCGTEAAR